MCKGVTSLQVDQKTLLLVFQERCSHALSLKTLRSNFAITQSVGKLLINILIRDKKMSWNFASHQISIVYVVNVSANWRFSCVIAQTLQTAHHQRLLLIVHSVVVGTLGMLRVQAHTNLFNLSKILGKILKILSKEASIFFSKIDEIIFSCH